MGHFYPSSILLGLFVHPKIVTLDLLFMGFRLYFTVKQLLCAKGSRHADKVGSN